MSSEESHHLLDGYGYRRSLRDGRRVFHRGELIDDVTAHPATSGGIDLLAEAYDAQFDPCLRIRIYNEFDRAGAVEAITDYLGLGASGVQS
jgi:aromatic ring hydroxylase